MNTPRWLQLSVTVAALAAARPARAQTFPTGDAWAPLRCATDVMTDRFQDESGALAERDLVGDLAEPAGAVAADAQYLYLRVRVEEDPLPEGKPRPFAWGILLDTEGDLTNYEVLVQVNGISSVVSLFRNTATTVADSPADPPDEPAVRTYSLSSHARSLPAGGTRYGADADYFLEVAVPWSDLEDVGIGRLTPVVAWAATSSTSASLNGDFACWDDGTGNPTLSGTASARTVLDPNADSDGDGHTDRSEYVAGTDPSDTESQPAGAPDANVLAGGGGCQTAPGSLALLGAAVALWQLARRR